MDDYRWEQSFFQGGENILALDGGGDCTTLNAPDTTAVRTINGRMVQLVSDTPKKMFNR